MIYLRGEIIMKKISILMIAGTLLFLGACKPTEKGYQAAYDAAQGKRQAVLDALDVNLPEGAIQDVDGAQLRDIDGVKVYVINRRIRPADKNKALPGSYNVAVGKFKMITNSESQSKDLQEDGFDAFPAKEAEGDYYTIAGSFQTLQEAVKFYEKYKDGKNRAYVGLPNAPVIIYSPL